MKPGLVMALAFVVLYGAVLVAGLAVVGSRHEARKLFAELQQLQAERDELDIEWGRLRLEQSAHATYGQIEKVAREQFQMSVPPPEQIVIVHKP